MGQYFQKFPGILYQDKACINLLARVKLKDELKRKLATYYNFELREGMRPDTVAGAYYKDPYLSWLVYIANDIVDPSFEWYMDQETFHNYVISKYGTVEAAQSTPAFYRSNWYGDSSTISTSSYSALSGEEKRYWDPNLSVDGAIINYRRKQSDVKVDTNRIIEVTYTGLSGADTIEVGDIVARYDGVNALVARGEVSYHDTVNSILRIRHVYETGTGFSSGTFTVRDKDASFTATGSTLIVANIPLLLESVYWEEVSYYDYEQELNESRRIISLLSSYHAQNIDRDLGSILSR